MNFNWDFFYAMLGLIVIYWVYEVGKAVERRKWAMKYEGRRENI